MRRKYSPASLYMVGYRLEGSVLQTSMRAESMDVTVETFEDVIDAENNDFFKVEFE